MYVWVLFCLIFRKRVKVYLVEGREDVFIYFVIFYKKDIEWDEVVEVEDINIVFYSYLLGK